MRWEAFHSLTPRARLRAVSLQEMLVVVAVLGIFAAIAIPNISGVVPGSEQAIAQRNLNLINGAVQNFSQSCWEMGQAAGSGDSDELAVLRSLQYRDAMNPVAGSPFLAPTMKLESSSSDQTYRASWNGSVFQLLSKGTAGTGIDLMKLSESATPYSYPSNYQPVGPN